MPLNPVATLLPVLVERAMLMKSTNPRGVNVAPPMWKPSGDSPFPGCCCVWAALIVPAGLMVGDTIAGMGKMPVVLATSPKDAGAFTPARLGVFNLLGRFFNRVLLFLHGRAELLQLFLLFFQLMFQRGDFVGRAGRVRGSCDRGRYRGYLDRLLGIERK